MGKHTDALKPFDQFRAPWETEGGTDAEIDKPKLKRWIHGILTDKAKAQDSREEVQEKLATAESELETARAEAADANGAEAQKKIDRLQAKVDSLTAERDKLVSDKEHADLRAEVLGDLDPKYAKYVQGETREDLEKSLEDVKADFGLEDKSGDEEEEEEEEKPVRTTPRSRLKNPADKESGKTGSEEIDFDAVASDIVGSGPFH